MQLVIQNSAGQPIEIVSDFNLDLQYGDGTCDYVLYVPNERLDAGWRILIDGTSFAGIIDEGCPSHQPEDDTITYKGRTVQGVLANKVIKPDAGQSHLVVSGDANDVIKSIIRRCGLISYLDTPSKPSGIQVSNYQFNRYVDAWTGLRMMLSRYDARLKFVCQDGQHIVSAVKRDLYGTAVSEEAYFDLDMEYLPVNHLIGLGKGEGADRSISEWYADALGNVSQTQSLFGINERELTYQLNGEEPETLPGKTKAKLEEYQVASKASLKLPIGADLDVGDRVRLSNSKFGITVEAEVINVIVKINKGIPDVSYKFGMPDYPKDED